MHTYTAKRESQKEKHQEGCRDKRRGKLATHSGRETKAETKQAHIQTKTHAFLLFVQIVVLSFFDFLLSDTWKKHVSLRPVFFPSPLPSFCHLFPSSSQVAPKIAMHPLPPAPVSLSRLVLVNVHLHADLPRRSVRGDGGAPVMINLTYRNCVESCVS